MDTISRIDRLQMAMARVIVESPVHGPILVQALKDTSCELTNECPCKACMHDLAIQRIVVLENELRELREFKTRFDGRGGKGSGFWKERALTAEKKIRLRDDTKEQKWRPGPC